MRGVLVIGVLLYAFLAGVVVVSCRDTALATHPISCSANPKPECHEVTSP